MRGCPSGTPLSGLPTAEPSGEPQPLRKPQPLGPGVTQVAGRRGDRAPGSKDPGRGGRGFLQSQPERAGSFQHLPLWTCDVSQRPNQSQVTPERPALPAGGPPGASFGNVLIFSFGKSWLPRSAAVPAPAFRRTGCGPFSPSGSCWLSPQSLSNRGAHAGLPLERLPGPACVSAPPGLPVSQSRGRAASSFPPHGSASSPPHLLSGRVQPASRCAPLRALRGGLPCPVLTRGSSPRPRGRPQRPLLRGSLGGWVTRQRNCCAP